MKINTNNTKKIEAALKSINGRATAWTIIDSAVIVDVAYEVETKLAVRDVRKANRIGTRVTFTPAGLTTAAYKNRCISTVVVLERFPSGWFMIDCRRTNIYPKESRRLEVCISDEARADMTRQFYPM